jgi:Galactose oxidase, central domain/Kelch motif
MIFSSAFSVSVKFTPETKSPAEKRSNSVMSYNEALDSLIIFSGINAQGYSSSLDLFNLTSNQWEIIQPKSSLSPQPRKSPACISVGLKFYILGGLSAAGPLSDIWVLDLNTSKVTPYIVGRIKLPRLFL